MRAMLRLRRQTKDSVRKVVMVTEDDARKLLVTPRLCKAHQLHLGSQPVKYSEIIHYQQHDVTITVENYGKNSW